METNYWREILKKVKEDYKKIRYVTCPAFNYEKVYFNKKGFDHLLRSGKNTRPISQQIRRINLLKEAIDIIATSNHHSKYKIVQRGSSAAHFWSIVRYKGDRIVIVIIRQLNSNPKHFFSVMDKSAKDP